MQLLLPMSLLILKSLLSKRFNFSPLFYWMVNNNSFVSRLFVQSRVFHGKIYPPVIVEINCTRNDEINWESDNGGCLKCVYRNMIEEEKSKMGMLDFLNY